MKKVFSYLLIFLAVFVLFGCSKEKVTKCHIKKDFSNYSLNSEYTVTSVGENVTLVESTETIKSNDKEVLDLMKSAIKTTYSPFNNLEYYDTELIENNGELISKAKINYAKIDTDKMIEINPQMSNFIKDGKLKTSDLITMYKTMGITCEE